MTRTTGTLGVALVLALTAMPALAADPEARTRATMDEIFAAMQILLPLSLDDERFQDPTERERILAALGQLADNGEKLEAHGKSRDAGFRYLSRSLARETRDIQRRYEAGQVPEARFLLHELASTCVACHSRLPYNRRFPLGERFVEETAVAALPLDERARYEMATRQFDRALASQEALFEAPDAHPADVDLLGIADDYLEVSIRVRGDSKRPRRTLQKFAEREDLSPSLRGNVESWVASLEELEKREPSEDPLVEGKALLAIARDESRFPDDRKGLVYYVAASGALHRFVDSGTVTKPTLAEAYYLLGLIESRIGRSLWLSQSEVFLESSIRLDPGSTFAPDAFALLEDVVVSGWTGSGGVHVPSDVETRLDELRQLVHEARPDGELPAKPEADSEDS